MTGTSTTYNLGLRHALVDGVALNYIGGRWSPSETGNQGESLDPSTGELLAHTVASGPDDATTALHAAGEAQPAWAAKSIFERGRIVLDAARLIRERAEAIARLMTMEEGKTLPDGPDAPA